MAPWRPTVHVWPTLWNTKKNFHPNVQPVQFSSWYLPPFGFYGSLKKCHFSLPWEWFSLFPFSWGGGAPQTPSHISSFDPLGVRNNQHQKNFFAPEPILKLSQSAPLKLLLKIFSNLAQSLAAALVKFDNYDIKTFSWERSGTSSGYGLITPWFFILWLASGCMRGQCGHNNEPSLDPKVPNERYGYPLSIGTL